MNLDLTYFFLVSTLAIVFALAALVSGGPRGVLAVVVGWWCFWYAVAASGATGLFPFALRTHAVLLTALIGAVIGGVLGLRFAARDNTTTPLESDHFATYAKRVMYVLGSFSLLWNLSLLPRALPLIASYGGSYRSAAFGEAAEQVFGSGWLVKIHSLTVTPAAYLSGFIAAVLTVRERKVRPLLFAFCVLGVMDLIRLGRAGSYSLVVLVGLAYVTLRYRFVRRATRRKLLGMWSVLAGSVLLASVWALAAISNLRDNQETVISAPRVMTHIVDYHTLGFGLLNSQLEDEQSPGMQAYGYGRLTLGGIEHVVSLIVRRFNPDHIVYSQDMDSTWRQEPVCVGRGPLGEAVVGNAFYTVLFSTFHDGRYVFTFLVSLLYGLSVVYQQSLASKGICYNQVLLIVLGYCGLFSIFLSPPEGTMFWSVLGLVLLLKIAVARSSGAGPQSSRARWTRTRQHAGVR